MYIYKSIAVLLKLKTSNKMKNLNLPKAQVEQLLEKSELKTVSQTWNKNEIQKLKFLANNSNTLHC